MINIKRLFIVFTFLSCFFTSEIVQSQKTNQYNSNNERTGVWKKYYPNKRIRYTGQFKNGKEIGVFKFYDIKSSKHPIAIKTFSENSDIVMVQYFSTDGNLKSEGTLKNRLRVGSWRYYYPNGVLMSEESYNEKGALHGPNVVYYPNEQITEFSEYDNGVLNGVVSKYSSKGILIEELTYQNGQLNGMAKFFELNGNIKEAGLYKDGMRLEGWKYYIDGEITTKKKQKTNYSTTKDN
ncbi:toxin-antitoxin system YwqK family antitoxin [Polaribacter tangerinus]|uniref:toxin-antitoxin system YwqK family antitoxin n=1 Tax=Polaribacter tangerinus TaxID=1920034 RepID=UPI000B4B07DE|nr:hypothetical protein [Polaribacter tangerinus]